MNISHYINEISSGNEYYTVQKKLRLIVVCLGLYHALLCVCFYINTTFILAAYNLFASLFYFTFVYNINRKNHAALALSVSICEVVLCSLVSTLCTGMDTGFAIYNVGCITGCFYINFVIDARQKQNFISFITSVILTLCYMFNYLISIYIPPISPIASVKWTRLLYISNYTITLSMIVVFTFLIVWEVRSYASKLEEQNQKLNEAALKDPLTHLYNRRSMNEILNTSMSTLKSKGKRFSVILGDIDNFKHVNDTYGHDAGDEVLKTVASTISECVETQGSVCRWGGEEILILINASIETASTIAERVRAAIEETVVTNAEDRINVTMTFGVAESIPGYKIENLIQLADDRLYYGKGNGKNQVVLSIPENI